MSDTDEIEALLERAAAATEQAQEAIEQDDLETVLERIEELLVLADEAEDITSRVDLADLVRTVDWSDLPDAVDSAGVVEAIRSGDVKEAVALRKLVSLSDLPELWDSVNVRELWREYREFEDALEDFGDETDENNGATARSDGGQFDGPGGLSEFDPETVENAVQSKVSDAVGEFRQSLLDARERLSALKETNRERTGGFENRSRNPTAGFSTMPSKGSPGDASQHSTIPEETRHSGAPNRRRIYGTRFEEATDE